MEGSQITASDALPLTVMSRSVEPDPIAQSLREITGPSTAAAGGEGANADSTQLEKPGPATTQWWRKHLIPSDGSTAQPNEEPEALKKLEQWIKTGSTDIPAEPKTDASPARVEQVRTQLESGVSDLISDKDRATLKQFRDGALDANPAAIQDAYKSVKDDPSKLKAMVKELNQEFAGVHSNVRFGLTDDNRLLLAAEGTDGLLISADAVQAATVVGANDGHIHLSQEQATTASVPDVMKAVREGICSEPHLYMPKLLTEQDQKLNIRELDATGRIKGSLPGTDYPEGPQTLEFPPLHPMGNK